MLHILVQEGYLNSTKGFKKNSILGVASYWQEEVRDSFIPSTIDQRTVGERSRIPYKEGMGCLLGI